MHIRALNVAIRGVSCCCMFWSYGLGLGTSGAIFSCFRCAARTVVEDPILPCDSQSLSEE